MNPVRAARPPLQRLLAKFLAAGALGTVAFALPHSAFAQIAEGYAKGRILVLPNAGLNDEDLDKALRPHGGKGRKIGRSDLRVVDLPPGASESAAVAALSRHPHIKFAELDRQVRAAAPANDPYSGSQWHLGRIGSPNAWDVSQGAGVTIAILDSGVDGTHPDLAARLVPGWNFIDNNANTADVHGHGTAVAGAAAATLNNGVGVASVAGAARLMPVRIADANAYAYWSTVAQGLTWAADNGARVANISYVGVAGSLTVQNAANYMKSKGGLVLVAAGNNGVEESIAPTTAMIPVSATNSSDALTPWSSWGSFVAVSAPGQDIWTTTRGGGYQAWWGTSIASPVTAGVVALMMSAKPSLPASQIESLLYSTAVDLGPAGRDKQYGHGRVNALAAVQAATAATSTADTQAPSVAMTSPGASSTVSGTVSVAVNATDNVGVAKVELRVNGALVATDTSAPYTFAWNSANTANGMASLTATAFDTAGNAGTTAALQVNVANLADVVAPVVSFGSPVTGTRVSGNVTVRVSASDNAGASGITMTLAINGTTVSTATGGSLSYTWNTRKLSPGSYTLTAIARDRAGNQSATSIVVTR